MLELGPGRREQLLDRPDVVVHRAADIEEQQELDGIVPLGPRLDVEIALAGGGIDRLVEGELLLRALAHPASQPLHGDADVAGAELDVVVEVLELALVPDLDRAAVAAFGLADAHAFGIVAIGAEGRGAAGADPFRAALVAALLLLEPLLQRLHQLVETAEALDEFFLLVRQVLLRQPAEPFLGQFARGDLTLAPAGHGFDALEDLGEHAVEAVDEALVLHQGRAGEEVEGLDVVGDEIGLHGL